MQWCCAFGFFVNGKISAGILLCTEGLRKFGGLNFKWVGIVEHILQLSLRLYANWDKSLKWDSRILEIQDLSSLLLHENGILPQDNFPVF